MQTSDLRSLMADAVQHHQAGHLSEAERLYRQILAVQPQTGAALNNLGLALWGLGRLEEAESAFRQVLALSPNNVEAQNSLAEVLHAQQKLDAAEAGYRATLALKPDHVSAAGNLGAVLWEQGKLEDAGIAYRHLLKGTPRDSEALAGLAAVTLAAGDPVEALALIRRVLAIQDSAKARRIFTDAVRQLRWTGDDPQIRALLTRALIEPWARPRDLANAAAGLIKQGGLPHDAAILAKDGLLLALLVSTQNTDIEIERFLALMRRKMLDAPSEAGLEFWSTLARQCFINEYVFFADKDETGAAEKLREDLDAALESGGPVPPLMLLTMAAYFPLSSLKHAARLLERSWPEPVAAVLAQQISEPAEERRLRNSIPALTPIADKVSQAVRAHYEENPYPRWIKPAPSDAAISIGDYLRQAFPLAPLTPLPSGDVELLSAGCGTGQLAIETARSLKARVLAMDLSLTSLAYAKRKAVDLANIEFAQGDLLALKDKSFDVIESSGVLHHLADPLAGWRTLLKLLKPGGVMLVALYSRTARRKVENTRAFIAGRGYGASADDIRRCRQDLLAAPERDDFMTVSASDFFGVSTCRDLLFHGQETLMDLGEIGAFLKQNSLTLLGFEIGSDVLAAYRRRFPDDATNLEHWQAFESDNPDTFAAMYNFWIQKPA